jgi:hypothetical protein
MPLFHSGRFGDLAEELITCYLLGLLRYFYAAFSCGFRVVTVFGAQAGAKCIAVAEFQLSCQFSESFVSYSSASPTWHLPRFKHNPKCSGSETATST